MIRRPPRSTQSRSSAASDVYKRQPNPCPEASGEQETFIKSNLSSISGIWCRSGLGRRNLLGNLLALSHKVVLHKKVDDFLCRDDRRHPCIHGHFARAKNVSAEGHVLGNFIMPMNKPQ